MPGVGLATENSLAPGSYLLQLAPSLADMAGNPLAQTYCIAFTVDGGGTVFLPLVKR